MWAPAVFEYLVTRLLPLEQAGEIVTNILHRFHHSGVISDALEIVSKAGYPVSKEFANPFTTLMKFENAQL